MTSVARVTVDVLLDNGDLISLNIDAPAPGGDNPRFITQQVNTALKMLEPRLHDALEAVHGPQHHRTPRPSDELLSPRQPVDVEPEQVVGYPGERLQERAPANGLHVRFPALYGTVVFETIDRAAGAYRVQFAPAQSLHTVGDLIQINTDVAVWESAE